MNINLILTIFLINISSELMKITYQLVTLQVYMFNRHYTITCYTNVKYRHFELI